MSNIQYVLDWQVNTNYGGVAENLLGRIPLMIDPTSPLSPEDQLEPFWHRFNEDSDWGLTHDMTLFSASYEPRQPAAQALLHNRLIVVYPGQMVLVMDPSNNYILGRIRDA